MLAFPKLELLKMITVMGRICYYVILGLSCLGPGFLLAQPHITKGIYGHPQALWDKGHNLSELGINAIFVRSHSIDSATVERAKQDGLKIYAEFATLNGKNYVEDNPDAWALDEQGRQVQPASWFLGVCPTNPGFFSYRMQQLRDLLNKYPLDGIWLDYLHWHAQFEEKEPILPETCFCEDCRTAFAADTELKLPHGDVQQQAEWILVNHDADWREWRCSVINHWVNSCREVIEEERPRAVLGIYHCPWTDEEHDGARRRILGLDFDALSKHVDVFSPMVYHGRMERSPSWVGEYVAWLGDKVIDDENKVPYIWPIVQAHQVPTADFESVLRSGLDKPATGVMMFTSRSVADNDEKINIVKKIYSKKH